MTSYSLVAPRRYGLSKRYSLSRGLFTKLDSKKIDTMSFKDLDDKIQKTVKPWFSKIQQQNFMVKMSCWLLVLPMIVVITRDMFAPSRRKALEKQAQEIEKLREEILYKIKLDFTRRNIVRVICKNGQELDYDNSQVENLLNNLSEQVSIAVGDPMKQLKMLNFVHQSFYVAAKEPVQNALTKKKDRHMMTDSTLTGIGDENRFVIDLRSKKITFETGFGIQDSRSMIIKAEFLLRMMLDPFKSKGTIHIPEVRKAIKK